MPRRTPIRWPDGARVTIIPCVAFETWPEDLGTPETRQAEARSPLPPDAIFRRDLCSITDRQYGERVGIYRMLELFEREGIQTTFFVNGINIERLPDLTREIRQLGHELGSESYIHDYSFMKSPEQERQDLRRTVAAFQEVLGERPLGYLSTGIRPTDHTPVLAAEEGYTYWMDPQHEELPYTLRVRDKELVVLSYANYLNDYSTLRSNDRSPRHHLEVWKDTFDYLHREGERHPGFMAWGLHPFLSGRPYRAKVLEEFIRYAKGHPGVWFARCIDVANWWRQHYREHLVEEWPNYLISGKRPVL